MAVNLSRGYRLGACLLVLGLTAAAAMASGNDAPHNITVQLEKGKVVQPESRRLMVPQGAVVAIRWRSDQRGELHLHGYDIRIELSADDEAVTRFEARATGRFPVTSHGFGAETGHGHGHGALLYLEVHPE